ncbi:MAG: serine hydrolase [Bacteroidota bacterium]
MRNQHPKLFGGFLVVAIFISCGHISYEPAKYQPLFMSEETAWADTTLQQLTLDQKIGQLFVLQTSIPNTPKSTLELAVAYQPGGLLLNGVSKANYAQHMQDFRVAVELPILELSNQLVSFNNQLSDRPNFPAPATLGALDQKYLDKKLHRKLLSDFRLSGVNCSLSPNIQALEDHPSNYTSQQQPKNDLELMSRATDKVEALQSRKILSVANHFDFYVDSIPDSTLIKSGIFNQYKPLVMSGLSGILVGEAIFAGDSITHRLPEFYKNFLKKYLDFDGLIFGQITDKVSLKELLYAGVSTIIVEEKDFAKNVQLLKKLVAEGTISESKIDEKVHQILMAKKWLGLDKKRYVQPVNYALPSHLDDAKELVYTRKLFEQSIILANNPKDALPFTDTYFRQFKVINVGRERLQTFRNSFFKYANFSSHLYRPKKDGKINALAFDPIQNGAFVITLDHVNLSEDTHQTFLQSIRNINEHSKVVVVNYGNPFNFQLLDSTIIGVQVFERNKVTEDLVPQLLFGAIKAKGQLPIAVTDWMPKGLSIETPITRLKRTIPEEVGISTQALSQIDTIFNQAIARKATPGGQVLIAKQGKVIYSKTFGHHTYEQKQRVEQTDLYDVASITKAAATTLATMRLYEEKQVQIDAPLKAQMDLPETATIKNITLKNLLIHKSGLQRNMPIAPYLNNRERVDDCSPYFCKQSDEQYSLEVANNFYLNPTYLDSIYLAVSQLPRNYRHRRYLYSDVNFYLIQQLLEQKMEADLDDYLKFHFYQPLGLRFLTYKPMERFTPDVIVPTQDDRFWRKGLVRGYVHDETAAILGGVGGNAGLFANADDLAVLFQMLLNGGEYGGQQFLQKETIDYFTSSKHGNHRGLGFDKAKYNYTASKSASGKTYGHNGFSGTCVWVDPQEELIYVFLSNRIHPNARNKELKKMRVRQRIHQVVYDAMRTDRTDVLSVNNIKLSSQ